jgi:hypothetical protein
MIECLVCLMCLVSSIAYQSSKMFVEKSDVAEVKVGVDVGQGLDVESFVSNVVVDPPAADYASTEVILYGIVIYV